MSVLNVLSHNEECRAEGITNPDEYVTVSRWQRLTAHFFSWVGHEFMKGSG